MIFACHLSTSRGGQYLIQKERLFFLLYIFNTIKRKKKKHLKKTMITVIVNVFLIHSFKSLVL